MKDIIREESRTVQNMFSWMKTAMKTSMRWSD